MADHTVIPCLNCGAEIVQAPSVQRKRIYRKEFCDKRCNSAYRYKTQGEKWRTPEAREKARQRARATWQAQQCDPAAMERKLASDRASYRRHADKRKVTVRAYADSKRDDPKFKAVRNLSAHRRRTRLAAAPTFKVSARDWERLLERWRHRCAYCAGEEQLTQEHVVPISRGGSHSIGNLLPVCKTCNSSKRDLLLVEWRYSQRPGAARIAA